MDDSAEYGSLFSNDTIGVTFYKPTNDLFCNNPDLQEVNALFVTLHKLYERVDAFQDSVLNTIVPQLLFMDEANYPPDIPKPIRSVLLAYAGKDLPLVANACSTFKDGVALLQDFLTELNSLEGMQPQLKQWMNQKSRSLLFRKDAFRDVHSVLVLSSLNRRCVFEPLLFLLMRLLVSFFTLHTIAQSLRPVFEMYRNTFTDSQQKEEVEIVYSHWCILQKSALFSPIPDTFASIPVRLSNTVVSFACSLVDRELQNYAKSFTHSIPLTGTAGLLLLLQKTSAADSNPVFQNTLRNARGCTHFESIFGNVNMAQCDSLMKLLSVSPISMTNIFNRLKHKQKYVEKMDRIIVLLHSLTVPDLPLTPDRVLLLLREGVSLAQRVGMSIEASCFCLTRVKPETRGKVIKVLVPLLLKHAQLVETIYRNPAVVQLLPVLMSAVLSTLGASGTPGTSGTSSTSSTSGTPDSQGEERGRVNDRLFDEATLLWARLNGGEGAREKAAEAMARYFLLLDVFRTANHLPSLATTPHTLAFNLSTFKDALAISPLALPRLLAVFASALNTDASLLQPLAPQRQACSCLPLLTRRLLRHAFFYAFFFPLHDHVNLVCQQTDSIVRKRVFAGNHRMPVSTVTTSVQQEVTMSTLRMMVNIPPFLVMGTSIDLCSLLTHLYSKNNYNLLISFTNDVPIHNLIAAHMSQFYNVQLVDGCIYPEQSSDATNSPQNGNGLFGIDYDTLDHFVFVLDEQNLLYFPNDVEVIGFLPSSCTYLCVLNHTNQKRYMERQNQSEILNSLYTASSQAEVLLNQLIESLQEPELTALCQNHFDLLFEEGSPVHAAVPEEVLLRFELELSAIDATILGKLVQSLNRFALLIILLRLYDQLDEAMQRDAIFGKIIGNFATLARHAVDAPTSLVFALILYRYAQTGVCFNSLVFGDSVYYGVAVLLQLFGVRRAFERLNVFRTLEKRFISLDERVGGLTAG